MSQAGNPEMDYNAHQETYDRFISLIKVSVVAILNILVALILFAFGGTWSAWSGTLIIVLAIVAGVIGLFAGPKGYIPSVIVFVMGLGLVVLTVS